LNEHASNAAQAEFAIFLIDSTLGKAFDSQRNNIDIFRKDSRGKQCAKEMLQSDQEYFYTNPLKSEKRQFRLKAILCPNSK
jgi:hypothetical protein